MDVNVKIMTHWFNKNLISKSCKNISLDMARCHKLLIYKYVYVKGLKSCFVPAAEGSI